MRRNIECTTHYVQVFLFLLTMVFGTSAQAVISPSERAALIDLYTSTNGLDWDIGASGQECSWSGVTCAEVSPGKHVVTDLGLSDSGLSGTIPASIGNLTSLLSLSLASNSLRGSIPVQMGGLINLQILSLSGNDLTGEIPTELGNLTDLTTLYLDSNLLTGPIPPSLGSLSNLQYLLLSSNQLSGSLPLELGNLANLKYLILKANKLTGVIPPELITISLSVTLLGLDMRYGGLHSTDLDLISALNDKQLYFIDFTLSQTLDATGLNQTLIGVDSVDLAWTPVTYDAQEGGYRVYLSSSRPDVFAQHGADVVGKASVGTTLSTLTNCTVYRARIHSYTSPHADNSNEVESDGELSNVLEFMTKGPAGCAPVITGGDGAFQVTENTSPSVITTITALDSDAGDTQAYSLSGVGSGLFSVHGGVLTPLAPLDYEAGSSYSLTVIVTDSTWKTDSVVVTINVLNVNEAPSITDGSGAFDVIENVSPYVITNIIASDLDVGDTLTYSLTGAGSDLFTIVGGALTPIAALNFEAGDIYSLTVTVTDNGGLTDSTPVTINVLNVNEAPSITDGSGAFDVIENVSPYVITNIIASDLDVGDTLTYSLTGGGSDLFTIVGGALTPIAALNFEAGEIYSLTVTVTDTGGLTDSASVTINVINVNDVEPAPSAGDITSPPENAASGTSVVTIAANDIDGPSAIFSITNGNIDNAFAIDGAGVITVLGVLNHEDIPLYTLTVEVDDGLHSKTVDVEIAVTDINDITPAPSAGDITSPSENATFGTSVVTIAANDVDGPSATFSITNGNVDNAFVIDGAGVITVLGELDFETTSSYTLTVDVNDGEHNATVDVVIELGNENDNFPMPVIADFNLMETVAIDTEVATVSATDADGVTEFIYTMTGSAFAIDESTGVITVAGVLDFETNPTYTETVSVYDGVNTSTVDLLIILYNYNDNAPILVGGAISHPAENAAIGTVVANIAATDPDGGNSFTYSILSGNDNGVFAIGSTDGVITVASALDYETTNRYTLLVQVSDGLNTATININVNVSDVSESSGGGGGGGGCAMRAGAEFDPVLLLWLCLSGVYLMRKKPMQIWKQVA